MRQCILVTAGLFLFVCLGSAQKPSFEVVSVRINKSGSNNSSMGPRGSRLVATNVTLRTLLMYAYRPPKGSLLDAQIVGGPDWTRTSHFDIEAKTEGDARVPPGEQTRAMVQSLLEDRFQLKVHRETRELPVYNLVLTKKGPKLSEDQTPPDQRQALISVVSQGARLSPLPRGALRMITGPTTTALIGTAIPISTVIELLQGQSDRIIVDKSEFHKLIDVHIEFSQNLAAAPPGPSVPGPIESGIHEISNQFEPSLFTAVQEAGLKLEPGKAPLEALVIDSVQLPSEN
ncbi:MAG TPA: TIGR03435 family protein [Bryobacteraceae bacterium]|nr:TIGR03435 family protein [Bryobacteraceae bacterium]